MYTPSGREIFNRADNDAVVVLSRTTSPSVLLSPRTDCSINSSCVGDASKPRSQIARTPLSQRRIPPPDLPIMKDEESAADSLPGPSPPHGWVKVLAGESDLPDGLFSSSLKRPRSSALSIASSVAPINSTLYFANTPLRAKSSAQFSAV